MIKIKPETTGDKDKPETTGDKDKHETTGDKDKPETICSMPIHVLQYVFHVE